MSWLRPSISLFWRTFFFLTLLLLGCLTAWVQTFQWLEFEPRVLQNARQLASLVNLSRAALVHSDAIERIWLVQTLVEKENLRIGMREPSDTYQLYDQDRFSRRVSAELEVQLGKGTIVAREVNGFEGLWIGFEIERDSYWLLADPERVGTLDSTTWLAWLGIALAVSLAGAVFVAGLLDRPLQNLSRAASRLREGDFKAIRLDENVSTSEIREVNVGFNRMAERLSNAEQERTLMLAGISHDLRTPLARLRLELEMSVPDEQARAYMASDIEQVTAIIDKFLDYARADQVTLDAVDLHNVLDEAVQAASKYGPLQVQAPEHEPPLLVKADAVELRRVLVNVLENAIRYGRSANGVAEVDITLLPHNGHVTLQLQDHGPGVAEADLQRLVEPFFRGDQARTAATGSGLGLAIAHKTIARMGGQFELSAGHPSGLRVQIQLQKA